MSLQDAVNDKISQGFLIHNLESYLEAVKRIFWLEDKVNINLAPVHLSTVVKEGETECPMKRDQQRQGKEQKDIWKTRMAEHRIGILASLFLLEVLLLDAAKILTISTVGGSHYVVINHVSQILQDHGHNVTNLLNEKFIIPEFKVEKISYQVINWHLSEDKQKEIGKRRQLLVKELVHNRFNHHTNMKIYEYFVDLCSHLLSRKDIMDSLRNKNFDLLFLDATDPCVFLIAEKLGKQFVAFLPTHFSIIDYGIPHPLSFVPGFGSSLTDQMYFWARVKNFLMSLDSSVKQREILSQYDSIIQEHFAEGSRPILSHLPQKAELWFVNSDFALDFAHPMLPNMVYVGGLTDKPVRSIPQDLEDFIIKFGDSGFVLVALGSIATLHQTRELIKEMNSAFAHLLQGVMWTCKDAHWPKDVSMAPNVKIMDWLPQTDLLAHPRIRLFVTHGGMNSIMEAIQHGVPMVGIPFFGDQVKNMVVVEAKKIGVSVQLETLKAETFTHTLKEVIEDKRYKSAAMAARAIRRSHPLTPSQRLVGWIDHILQTGGGAHLKPHGFQQPWHVQSLLDVLVFLLGLTVGTLWLLKKMLGLLLRSLGVARKEKKD
ncbi:UDP-glucuronosyltransferase 3A2-like [Onychomys torridus]|uniref:UDP-glucuronosyltransferase 3A2-like n=1 Tax=Onychomys torridus TaxID=38674 RepID=UPI00167FAA50|nr:UDP-glucuronosyltransferase 3A2-like [Onychomys torridus]